MVQFTAPHPDSGNAYEEAEEEARSERSRVPGDIGGERGNGTEEEDEPSLYADVAALLDNGLPDPPEPVLLKRSDGNAIFYSGQVNWLFGDPETGKTLVAQAAGAEAMQAGRKVVFVDIDHNGIEGIVSRFLDMDVKETVLRDLELFRYVEPEDKEHLMKVVADLRKWRPGVVVVDSIGELLPLMGLNSNSPDDFTIAHTAVLKPLARAGAAVIAIDHPPKNPENKANGPSGTAAKRRAVGGVAIRVVVEDQFTPGQGGSAFLTVNKDRHGGLRRHCPPNPGKEQVAGLFKVEPHADRIVWRVLGPKPGDVPKADRVDPADLEKLDKLAPEPTSVDDVKARCRWGSGRSMKALREWRSRRSSGVPGEPGTEGDNVLPLRRSPFPPYVPGNGERSACGRCGQLTDRLIQDLCPDCAYPAGGSPDDDQEDGQA